MRVELPEPEPDLVLEPEPVLEPERVEGVVEGAVRVDGVVVRVAGVVRCTEVERPDSSVVRMVVRVAPELFTRVVTVVLGVVVAPDVLGVLVELEVLVVLDELEELGVLVVLEELEELEVLVVLEELVVLVVLEVLGVLVELVELVEVVVLVELGVLVVLGVVVVVVVPEVRVVAPEADAAWRNSEALRTTRCSPPCVAPTEGEVYTLALRLEKEFCGCWVA